MASGYNSRQSVRNNYSDDRSSPRSSVRRNRSPSENDDPNSQTRNVVDKFKDFIRKKIDENAEINEKVVEMGVSTIRRQLFREQCRISTWKKNLPPEIEDCSDDILICSIAYGNNPDEVKPIIQEKINQPSSSNISIVKVIGPLKKIKVDLDRNREVNLFRKVRDFDDDDIDRANRLFYSEAVHSVPGVVDYTYENAAEAVEGIRNCNREVNDNSCLYPVMKVCRSADEVREYLENNAGPKSTRNTTSSIQSSPPMTRSSRNRTYSSSEEEQKPTTRRPERR